MKSKIFSVGLVLLLSNMLTNSNVFAGSPTCNWGVSFVLTCWWPPHNDKVTKFCDCEMTPEFEAIGGLCGTSNS
jgi:hypothetical protein